MPDPAVDPQVAAQGELLVEYLTTAQVVREPVLPLRAALEEVVAVCQSVLNGREPPRPHDRRSMMTDVQGSLRTVGSELKRKLEPTLSSYQHDELGRLPALFDDVGGVLQLQSATKLLLSWLLEPASAQAIWRDLVSEVESGADVETCLLRMRQLYEIEEGLGHDVAGSFEALREIAREGRFVDGEEVLSSRPHESKTAEVAWFIFANAYLRGDYRRVGQVQFFSDRLLPRIVTNAAAAESDPGYECPVEVDQDALKILTPRDGSPRHVYARVELRGPRAAAGNPWSQRRPPEQWARELVSGIVEAATFRLGGSSWRLLAGSALYHGAREGGSFERWTGDPLVFDDAAVISGVSLEKISSSLLDRTGVGLDSLEPRFAERLAASAAAAKDAVSEVRWYEATQQQADAAQRVVLHVRAFERALPTTATERWMNVVKRYFREGWALDQFDAELFELARRAHTVLRRHCPSELHALGTWITDDGVLPSVHGASFLREAGQIAALAPNSARVDRRALRQVAKWAEDPRAMHKRLEELAQWFDVLLSRAVRQRNAVVHGVTTVREVVASVDPFVAWLAACIVARTVRGAGSGENLIDSLERSRQYSRRVFWRLAHEEVRADRVVYGGAEAINRFGERVAR